MKQLCLCTLLVLVVVEIISSFRTKEDSTVYISKYHIQLKDLQKEQLQLKNLISQSNFSQKKDLQEIIRQIHKTRCELKKMDFWLRYFEPIAYKKINGPLPVEWETEVFEKFEKPYRREGAGLTLAELYVQETVLNKDSLLRLVDSSILAVETFSAAGITDNLKLFHHFYLCNRLFLLNLAAIYTTGFECPDTSRIIPELRCMLSAVASYYTSFNQSFPSEVLSGDYLTLFEAMISFVNEQPVVFSAFDHFTFIKEYVNPLFLLNQKHIHAYKVHRSSFLDYSLSRSVVSIFDKQLYDGQNHKGIFRRVTDSNVLSKMDYLGKLLFYDPILSDNNKRSCVSCHKPSGWFTDTTPLALQFNGHDLVERNTPSLINTIYNHLIMVDGKHITLQDQVKAVINNPIELGGNTRQVVEKIMSCNEYKNGFTELLAYTPWETEINIEHIASVITYYYSKFSCYCSSFDAMVNNRKDVDTSIKKGFNLFMSKAQCGTCHFVPQFNGVKPPYIGVEFEVIGVPADTTFRQLSSDEGRYRVHSAREMRNAFRTGTIRNAARTAPYMHNGVFKTLEQVVDFYDAGGGAGRNLLVPNQTLSADSLHLSAGDKKNLILFIESLTEKMPFEASPIKLPLSTNKHLNKRISGGVY